MRDRVFLFMLVGCISIFGQQSIAQKNWQLGVSGGSSMGNVSSSNTLYEFTKKNGFRTGIFARYQLNNSFAIVTEVELERRGFSSGAFNYGLSISDTSRFICWECYYQTAVDYQSFYLTLPLYLTFQLQQGDFGFFLKSGMYYALMLQSFQDGYEEMFIDAVTGLPFAQYGFEPGRYRNIFSGRTENVVNTYDAGMLFGVGLSYSISSRIGLLCDATTHIGMVGYFENPEMVVAQFRGSSLRVGIYYKIVTTIHRTE